MGTKLTLSLDEQVIQKAKRFASAQHKSLSKVVEDYLAFVTEREPHVGKVTPVVRSLAETIRVSESDDDLKLAYLREKYLDA